MKVKALIDCVGLGYDLKKDDTTELKKDLAQKLVSFNYVEEIKEKSKKKSDD